MERYTDHRRTRTLVLPAGDVAAVAAATERYRATVPELDRTAESGIATLSDRLAARPAGPVTGWAALLGTFRAVFTAPSFAIFTELPDAGVLTAYKYQPNLERRHHVLKSVQGRREVADDLALLEKPHRTLDRLSDCLVSMASWTLQASGTGSLDPTCGYYRQDRYSSKIP